MNRNDFHTDYADELATTHKHIKTNPMTPQEKVKELAELDGFTSTKNDGWGGGFIAKKDGKHFHHIGGTPEQTILQACPDYLESYDAIVPLIQKQPLEVIGKVRSILKDRWLMHTPSELGDALLIATGRMR